MKILITAYTFDASAKTITLTGYGGGILLESVLLITNVTDNVIIYNFADATKGGSVATNVLTLDFDVTAMDDADDLQIWYQDESAVQPVSLASVPSHAVTNAGTFAVQNTASTPAGTNNIGDVDVLTVPADPFGANADAAVAAGATGSIQAKLRRLTQGVEDLKTLIVLGAGTNAIGKLAANSGVDIGDVDVTSLPALAAGTNLIGKTASVFSTDTIYNGTTALTPKFAKIDRATNADGAAVVNLVASKKIRVLTHTLICAGTVSYKWQSSTSNSTGAGSNTDLTGLMSHAANTGVADTFSPVGLFETAAGEALKLNLNAAVQVSGYLTYIEV